MDNPELGKSALRILREAGHEDDEYLADMLGPADDWHTQPVRALAVAARGVVVREVQRAALAMPAADAEVLRVALVRLHTTEPAWLRDL